MPSTQRRYMPRIMLLQQFDVFLFQKFNTLCHQRLKQISVWISKTGDGYLYAVLPSYLYLSNVQYAEHFFYLALAGFAIELPLYIALKQTLKRARPFNTLSNFNSHIAPSDKFSMPSGHTSAAFVFATLISAVYPTWAILAYAWASIIGLSRVILGVHFPGDIFAGALLGCGCAQFVIQLSM